MQKGQEKEQAGRKRKKEDSRDMQLEEVINLLERNVGACRLETPRKGLKSTIYRGYFQQLEAGLSLFFFRLLLGLAVLV